jgi:hypothetical protein
MADDRGGGQSCNFRGRHEVNLELGVELNRFLTRNNIPERLMFSVAPSPDAFAQQPIFQRQLKIETLRTGSGGELRAHLDFQSRERKGL